MLFNSWIFAIFFVIVGGAYWALQRHFKLQNVLLLVASYIFYGWWDIRFLYLITLCTIVDYVASLLIDRGRLGFWHYVKSIGFLWVSAFFCVVVNWKAVQVSWSAIHIDWNAVLPGDWTGWWVLVASVVGSLIFVVLTQLIRAGKDTTARFYLIVSVSVSLIVLGVFKYFNFFADSFIAMYTRIIGHAPFSLTYRIVLPVGISFFTFQAISHTVDVYRKKIPAGDSLIDLATFIAFFPQLVAGPIERGAHLLPQFQRPRSIDAERWREGMWLIFWGLYKKIVIADNIAKTVNGVFGPYDTLSVTSVPHDGVRCLLGLYAFALQIYCDFSGYTDIARGTARLLGFDILLNFNLPYFAVNPSDFWRRWHISLSSWLKDYLYIPLGGNRGTTFKVYRNLMLTMILGGLWHGAAWTFVLWGLYHGLLLVTYRILSDKGKVKPAVNLKTIAQVILMFHLICFGWLLFRAQNLTTVYLFVKSIVTQFHVSAQTITCLKSILYYGWFLIIFQMIQGFTKDLNPMRRWPLIIRLTVWTFIIVSLLRLAPGKAQEFIYFAF